jgi:hypothetical protein
MHELTRNLELAQSIKSYVKHRVICSNDIIPRALMPSFYLDFFAFYENIFGSELVKLYLGHTAVSKLIRETIDNQAQKLI